MDVSNIYIPDPKKWLKYYEKMIHNNRESVSMPTITESTGSIALQPTNNHMEVLDTAKKNDDIAHRKQSSVSLNLVSPIKRNVEQAKGEIEREKSRKRRLHKRKRHSKKGSVQKRKSHKHTKLGRSKKIQKKNKKKDARTIQRHIRLKCCTHISGQWLISIRIYFLKHNPANLTFSLYHQLKRQSKKYTFRK